VKSGASPHSGKASALVHTPADYGIVFETVAFRPPDESITLRAWWMPAPSAKAAIILVHGGGDDNRSLPYADGLALARDLVAHGYAVLALDLRNYGESDASPEGVTFGDLESNDLIGAMSYLTARHPHMDVGTAAVILPWHDPLRVAENAAVLDLLSGGKLRFGMGRGLARREFAAWSVPGSSRRAPFARVARTCLSKSSFRDRSPA